MITPEQIAQYCKENSSSTAEKISAACAIMWAIDFIKDHNCENCKNEDCIRGKTVLGISADKMRCFDNWKGE